MNFRPLHDRILVKRIQSEDKTAGGLYIPDNAKEKPMEGLVVAVGIGKRQDDGNLIKPDVKVGETVLFGRYSGNEIKIDGAEHIVMREDDLLGIIEK